MRGIVFTVDVLKITLDYGVVTLGIFKQIRKVNLHKM